MKINIFVITLAFFSMNMSAQISVVDSDIISVGDVIYQALDTMPSSSISVGNSGANQFWDFSSLQETEVEIINVISPVGTIYESIHPNANICVEMDNEILYINKSSSGVVMVGLEDLSINTLLLPLPLTYNLTYQDGPNTIFDSIFPNPGFIPGSLAPTISLNPLHNQVDSLKVKAVVISDFHVDAWGSITIPAGNYDALRMKVEEVTTTEFYTYCSTGGLFGGWYTAPPSLIPVETEIAKRYQWWSNDPMFKFMLAELELDSLDNVDEASFLITQPPASVPNLSVASFNIYPIPATGILTIDAEDNELTKLELVDVNGKVIVNNEFSQSTSLDVSGIAKGIYYINLKTIESSVTKKLIIK